MLKYFKVFYDEEQVRLFLTGGGLSAMSEYFSGDKKILDNIDSVPDRREGEQTVASAVSCKH